MTINWFKYSAPATFYGLAGKLIPWFAVSAAILAAAALYIGFYVAPVDAQQGEFYRIIFIHVPASILSMFLYLIMAGYAALGLIFKTRLSSMMATAIAPTEDTGTLSKIGCQRTPPSELLKIPPEAEPA